MDIIKNAFSEGRETDVDWYESNAKKDAIKLDVALENLSTMSSREKHALIPIQKICPDTGNVLATFPSRLAACRHIVDDILKNPNKNPLSVSGNMEMCMRGGWKSYGFYWKIVEQTDTNGSVVYKSNWKKIYYRNGTQEIVFKTLADTARHFGVSTDKMRAILNGKNKGKDVTKGAILQVFNPTPQTITVSNIADAARHAGCNYTTMKKAMEAGHPINNYTYKIVKQISGSKAKKVDRFIPTGYDLFKDGKKIGSYVTITEMAAKNQLHRQTINKKIVKGLPITRDGRLTVKTRYAVKTS